MKRPKHLAAIAVFVLISGVLAACEIDVRQAVENATVETAKTFAGEVLIQAIDGDTKARQMIVEGLAAYCDRLGEDTRSKLRDVLSIDGTAAITVDCTAVDQLAAKPPETGS
jgi:predicted butyrate kinase (DUF1464 family)